MKEPKQYFEGTRRAIWTLMAVLALCMVNGLTARAETQTGTTNNGLTYSYDTETKTVTYSGTDSGYSCWTCPLPDSIQTVVRYVKFDNCTVSSLYEFFYGMSNLRSVDFSGLDTSAVTDMWGMFYNCVNLRQADLSGLDLSSVTDMAYMFGSCSNLTSVDWGDPETSNVTEMEGMFRACTSLTSLDLSGFDTSGVTDMRDMFSDCSSLTSLDLSSFDTSGVTDMRDMFSYCSSLTSLDLSSFDTSGVTGMSCMFYDCSSLENLDLSGFDTSNVTNMGGMFGNCSSLTSLDLSGFDTSNVTDMGLMFYNCGSLASLDVSSFDTSSVVNMNYMFENCDSLASLDLSSFDASSVVSMEYMFYSSAGLRILKAFKVAPSRNICALPETFYDEDGNEAAYLTSDFAGKTLYRTGWMWIDDAYYWCEAGTLLAAKAAAWSDTIEQPEDVFADVAANGWYRNAVRCMYNNGYMTGKKDTTFGTADTLTRAELVQILYSIAGKPSVTYSAKFNDVGEWEWYTDAVLWASQEGIASGYPNGKFGVSDPITREQLALMLYQFATQNGYSMTADASLDGFSDVASVSSWAQTGIQWAVTQGVISGKSSDGGLQIAPQDTATRAECAQMMFKLLTSQQ